MSQSERPSEPDPEPSGRRIDVTRLLHDLALDDAEDGTIHLLCIRPPGDFERFDARLAILATRYAEVRITQVPARHVTAILPTVVLIRNGQIVGEAIGDLPLRELDEVVRCAATWPSVTASAA